MIETNELELKLKLCKSFIVKEVIALDPLSRRQWLFTYKSIIQYVDSHGSELSKEQILGADNPKQSLNGNKTSSNRKNKPTFNRNPQRSSNLTRSTPRTNGRSTNSRRPR